MNITPHQFWCIGRNYTEHAAELGNAIPEKPLIFLKSGGCLQTGRELTFPKFCEDIHHELEIVLLMGEDTKSNRNPNQPGPNLKPTHWTLGLDFTERKIQNELKKQGHPWELAKSFKGSAALGPWQKLNNLNELSNLEFSLKINGTVKQKGSVPQMIFNFEKIIQYISAHFPLAAGEAIFTGTPSGVGPVKSGDSLVAQAGPVHCQWKIG